MTAQPSRIADRALVEQVHMGRIAHDHPQDGTEQGAGAEHPAAPMGAAP